ncbi:MAG: dihydrofolate reductase [Treponema sp.]|nr:dihydrofolate reductase [Treponema sp.]
MIAVIAAVAKNRALGKNGKLPWKLPCDLAHFKKLTINNVVIMGRKTFESIEKQLPNRITIVISKMHTFSGTNLYTARSFAEAMECACKTMQSLQKRMHIFAAGGAAVYAEAIPLCDKMFITKIDAACDGDVFFPEFDEAQFSKKIGKKIITECVPYTFVTYKRI